MYQIPQLLKYKNLYHFFSDKSERNMASVILGKPFDFNVVLENRKKFLRKIKVNMNSCICIWVLGKDGVGVAGSQDKGISMKDYRKAVKIDSLITNHKGLYLFLLTADCAPVIVFDPIKKTIGLVHVGWKGADLNIVQKVILKMHKEYDSDAKDMVVGIGPCARKDSFIKKSPSQIDDLKWKKFLEPMGNMVFKVDFLGLCKEQLVNGGVKEENIFDCYIDTARNNNFFSHTRERELPLNQQGRFACIVGIK
ncbi:hypothetical protein A2159_00360 [Candidatus Woesebacteria bacterium RBG_13_34_9]|uniref:Purine nucleoside phosphorylase n=1 Tax=Candidatus Woesebacteria bacterium RBG_13_34_9 TaxID=1802477 RepID=A0A1F7X4Q5_9BACT|nr:MAG: hypothetical protein A2159_00360 [Candidatus Woesebacteria bacterium RBG_13_34_9]